MTDKEAKSRIREYEGQDLTKVGAHISKISSYNYNFYHLPNDAIVLLISDDDNCSDVFLVDGQKQFLVGIQYDNDGFMVGDFS